MTLGFVSATAWYQIRVALPLNTVHVNLVCHAYLHVLSVAEGLILIMIPRAVSQMKQI